MASGSSQPFCHSTLSIRTDIWCSRKTCNNSRLRSIDYIATMGVATGWTGVDMSTPLLPEIVPEIDANPEFLLRGNGYHNYLGFREFAKYGECSKFAASVGHQKLKGFQLQGALPLSPDQRLCPWSPLGAPPPDSVIPRARHACPPHIF